jgi:hypothetical protein
MSKWENNNSEYNKSPMSHDSKLKGKYNGPNGRGRLQYSRRGLLILHFQ